MAEILNYPQELIGFDRLPEDVSVLVGENGSGKSTLLNQIALHHVNAGRNVIGLANSIYDKFNIRRKNFKILRSSHGKLIAKKSILSLLEIIGTENSANLFGVIRAFEYIGFDRSLGIKLKRTSGDIIFDDKPDRTNVINSFLDFYAAMLQSHGLDSTKEFLQVYFDNQYFKGHVSADIFRSLKRAQLKKHEIIQNFDFALMKNGRLIELFGASSGELTLLSSLLFISANIDENTVIVIDEPENSLHPKWQIDYIRQILDLFHLYQPKIVIATHSPLIINGGKLNVENINIFKGSPNGFFLQDRNKKNVEEIYEEYFDVTTPENRYLSDLVMSKFNLLVERKMQLPDFENLVKRFIDQSYDELQKQALRGIILLAQTFDSNTD